jgi:glycosyltransferase involved in cell wall biosynthesis
VRYADGVVVPSHAVAQSADELLGLGERIRVVGSSTSLAGQLPADASERAERLELPSSYVLGIATPETAAGLEALREHAEGLGAPLLVLPPPADPADLAVAISRAAVLVYPAAEAGFGMTVLDALTLGTPVVHSDAAALEELTAGAAVVVAREGEDYGARLAAAVGDVLSDRALTEQLRFAGHDRARAFTWRSAAEKVWQLHADL